LGKDTSVIAAPNALLSFIHVVVFRNDSGTS